MFEDILGDGPLTDLVNQAFGGVIDAVVESLGSEEVVNNALGLNGYKRALIFEEIHNERLRQNDLHGAQSLPDGTNDCAYIREAWRVFNQSVTDGAAMADELSWSDVLDEEIAEAYAEEDWPAKRKELVEAAAVIVAWIEDGDKRG